MKRRGFLIVLSGPSGAGKSTLLKKVVADMEELHYSVSATTRSPRENEVDGKNYYFLSQEDFEKKRRAGHFLEWAEVHGNLYGTPREYIEENLEQGNDLILDLDIQGARSLRQQFEEGILVFVAPPSIDELASRIYNRGAEIKEEIRTRLTNAKTELQYIDDYDYFILNDDLDRAVNDLKSIIRAEQCRISRLELKELPVKGGNDDD